MWRYNLISYRFCSFALCCQLHSMQLSRALQNSFIFFLFLLICLCMHQKLSLLIHFFFSVSFIFGERVQILDEYLKLCTNVIYVIPWKSLTILSFNEFFTFQNLFSFSLLVSLLRSFFFLFSFQFYWSKWMFVGWCFFSCSLSCVMWIWITMTGRKKQLVEHKKKKQTICGFQPALS